MAGAFLASPFPAFTFSSSRRYEATGAIGARGNL